MQVSQADWENMVPEVAQKIAAAGISVTYPKVFLDPGELFECAGNVADNYFIFPNGRVYRCPLCEDYPIHALAFENDYPAAKTEYQRIRFVSPRYPRRMCDEQACSAR